MTAFRYDLHVHSCLSPCGDDDMTPNNIAGMAHLNGLDLVALTDHNACGNCPAFFQACEQYGIVAVAGMELTTAEDIHLVCLFETLEEAMAFDTLLQPYRMRIPNKVAIFGHQLVLDAEDRPIREEPHYLPIATTLGLEDAAELVRAHGGACHPAHIDREANGLLATLGMFPPTPVFSFAELRDADKAELCGGRQRLICSDAHRLWELKEGGEPILLEAERDDADAVRRALLSWLRRGT